MKTETLNNLFNQKSQGISTKARLIYLGTMAFLGVIVAGQHFARSCAYDGALGFNIGGWYFPGAFLVWLAKWGGDPDLQDQLLESGSYGAGVLGVGIVAYLFYERVVTRTDAADAKLHGSAQWATLAQVKSMGIYDKAEGAVVGGIFDEAHKVMHYLRHNGPEHIMCFAPTRSGKGVSLVMPTVLSWQEGSMIVTDLKGELANKSGGWRSKYLGNTVIYFRPEVAEGSAAWNPLEEIEIGEDKPEYAQAEMLANLIINDDGKAYEGTNAHWGLTARDFLIGLILYAIYKHRDDPSFKCDLAELYFMMADGGDQLLEDMANYPHRIVSAAGKVMQGKPEQERGSVSSSAKAKMGIYQDAMLRKNIDHCDFHLHDIMDGPVPTTVYLITSPAAKDRLRPLLRIFLEMFLKKNTDLTCLDEAGKSTHRHRCLMMVDEFPAFGKLSALSEGIAFIAGYGIKCYLITQDLKQLKEKYGDKESITSNCHVQIAFAPNNMETARYLSELCGETTVTETHYSVSGRRLGMFLNQVSRNTQQTKRALLTPDETTRLRGLKKNEDGEIEPGDMIVKLAGEPPILGRQALYFRDPVFVAREKVEPEPHDGVTRWGAPVNLGEEKPAEQGGENNK